MPALKPSIGRQLWFFAGIGKQEEAATVIDVQGDNIVTLYVLHRNGDTSVHPDTMLLEDTDEDIDGEFARWPARTGTAVERDKTPVGSSYL